MLLNLEQATEGNNTQGGRLQVPALINWEKSFALQNFPARLEFQVQFNIGVDVRFINYLPVITKAG